jgi:hypothetical protein
MPANPSLKFGKAALLGAAFFVVRGAGAGEQLTTAQLVQQSEAVVVVDNTLDRKGTVQEWLSGSAALAPKLGPLAGVCVPDKALLQQWLASHPRHAGRETWKKALDAGHVEQVVFLTSRGGALVPTCETEVMLGRSFALHVDHAAFRAELAALLVPPPPVPAVATTPMAPATATPPAPPSTPPAPPSTSTAPPSTSTAPASTTTPPSGCL